MIDEMSRKLETYVITSKQLEGLIDMKAFTKVRKEVFKQVSE